MGSGVRVNDGVQTQTTPADIPWAWTDPLAIDTKQYRKSSDMFSFGVLLFEIGTFGASPEDTFRASGIYPGSGHTRESWVALNESDRWAAGADTNIRIQAQRCWNAKASERPTAEDLVRVFQPEHDQSSSFP